MKRIEGNLPGPMTVVVGFWIAALVIGVPATRSMASSSPGPTSDTSTTSTSSSSTTTTTLPPIDHAARLAKIGVPADQVPIFIGAYERTGLDPLHLAAQIKAESGFQNHRCRMVNVGTRNENHICGIAQLGLGWGTEAERMDITYSLNRQADGIAAYMLEYDQNWQMAWRKYHSDTPYQGGNCGKHCRQYVKNIERYIADGSTI